MLFSYFSHLNLFPDDRRLTMFKSLQTVKIFTTLITLLWYLEPDTAHYLSVCYKLVEVEKMIVSETNNVLVLRMSTNSSPGRLFQNFEVQLFQVVTLQEILTLSLQVEG